MAAGSRESVSEVTGRILVLGSRCLHTPDLRGNSMRQYNSIHLAWHGAVGRLLFGFVLWSCIVALWRPPCAWAEEAGLKTETIIGARSVSGTVFWDKNENGTRDADEPGLPGIRLLAGHKVSVTDAEGKYSIFHPEPFHVVSLSFPSGMWPTAGWFRRMTRANETGVDFGLRKEDQALPFLFVQFTDPHGDHPVTMPMMHAECDVRLEYGGREFVDQHRIFKWLFTPILTQKTQLYFDLSFPGPPVHWQITQAVVPR